MRVSLWMWKQQNGLNITRRVCGFVETGRNKTRSNISHVKLNVPRLDERIISWPSVVPDIMQKMIIFFLEKIKKGEKRETVSSLFYIRCQRAHIFQPTTSWLTLELLDESVRLSESITLTSWVYYDCYSLHAKAAFPERAKKSGNMLCENL